MHRLLSALPLLFVTVIGLSAQEHRFDTVRVCSYRIDLFDSASHDRIAGLRTILNAIGPRVLCVQNFTHHKAIRLFRDSVMNTLDRPLTGYDYYVLPPEYGYESFSVIFYDRTTFRGDHSSMGLDSLRGLMTVRLYHTNGDSMLVMTAGWKEGNSADDVALRVRSAGVVERMLTKNLPEKWGMTDNILLAGTLNLRNSDEPAYQALVRPDSGRFVDPIDRPGDWHADVEEFADIHTHDTRSGLIDRFDQILVTPSLMSYYLPGSYTTVGNDGAHFGDSIAALPNSSVSPELARALQDASDHLPVFIDLLFEQPSSDVPRSEEVRGLDLTDGAEMRVPVRRDAAGR